MYGSIQGNLIAIIYFMYFQLAGLLLARTFFHRENPIAKLLLGSTMGSLLLTWLPILMAFLFDFTVTAHIVAAVLVLPLLAITKLRSAAMVPDTADKTIGSKLDAIKNHALFLFTLSIFLIFWGYLLHTHTILPNEDGGIYTGQCTYGDMNMHLGFITSLTIQQTFPPEYSIMPGVRLSYPFLSDSISASLYCFGSSLRLAYILPMIFAMAQIVTAVYLLAETLFASLRKSMLTLVFFFLNGGFGFAYFCNWSREGNYTFSDIFTGFYTTPTNLIDENIRWVNLIADMFLPQRATLFGYAVLFPALWLLYCAVFQSRKAYFISAGLFVAALPMIHTHSFLSAGIISAAWLLLWLYRKVISTFDHTAIPSTLSTYLAPTLFVGFLAVMCYLQSKNNSGALPAETLMILGISIFIAAVIYGLYLLISHIKAQGFREILPRWGAYLAIILCLALPQLLFWTFGQVAQGSFVRGHFNWGNQGDSYLWFYLKNIGAVCFPIIGSIFAANRKKAPLFLPVLFLWWLGELIVFTPNTYDNNKLLYVAYLLLCLAAADYAVDVYDRLTLSLTENSRTATQHSENQSHKWKGIPGRSVLAGIFLFTCTYSAILTLGREVVSEYQLYNPAQVALAEYIEENTAPDAVFLTNTRHNNEIASLTGRNIVCGADSFLYFHGLDTTERKKDLRLMYESPAENMHLYEKYEVDYIVISNYEKNSYQIDQSQFDSRFTTIFTYKDVTLYQVTPPSP